MSILNICLVVEGDEEEHFFENVKKYICCNTIKLIIVNASGEGNIPAYFQTYESDEIYDYVFCVYDVDNLANDNNSNFNQTRKKLFRILGTEKAVDAISLCTNPNILQWNLLACDKLENVALKSTSKSENTPLVHKYWDKIGHNSIGKKSTSYYSACKWQLQEIDDSFEYGTYRFESILKNGKEIDKDYKNSLPGSNLLDFLNAIHDGNIKYFDSIRSIMKEKDDVNTRRKKKD